MKQFKNNVFDESIPVIDTISKYFKFTKSTDTEHNIAYKNSSRKLASKMVRQRFDKRGEYEVGETLVCRNYFKLFKKITFNANYEYEITSVKLNTITLDHDICVPIDIIRANFIHGYCKTCHSFQGSSINKPMAIFDWKFQHVNRKWIYTACTRATNLSYVLFFN